jgi:hypothetical protein
MPGPLSSLHRGFVSGLSRVPKASCLCGVALLLDVALAWAQAPAGTEAKVATAGGSPSAASAATEPAPLAPRQMREGTELVDQRGVFKVFQGRAAFLPVDGKRQLICLENLNLERVVRTIADNPEQLQWLVSGSITEYRGSNYLLVSRAILKGKPAVSGPSNPYK